MLKLMTDLRGSRPATALRLAGRRSHRRQRTAWPHTEAAAEEPQGQRWLSSPRKETQ